MSAEFLRTLMQNMEHLMKWLFAVTLVFMLLSVAAKAQDQAVIQCKGQTGVKASE
jgi:hypothetical protein